MKYTFKTLFFEATRECNFACPMCMASSNNKELVAESLKRQLNTEEIEEYVFKGGKEIALDTITWSGGEFILRPDATELVHRATAYGYSSIVTTNGAYMDREKLLELKKASGNTVVIAVGINSIDEKNVETRDIDCDVALQVLELCEELEVRRNVVVTVGKHNLESLGSTLQWLEDRNIPFNRSPFTPRGSGTAFREELGFTVDDMERYIHPELRKHPLGYISYTPFFLSPEVHERYSKGSKNVTVPQSPSIGCWCGTWLAMNAEGDVAPCAIMLDDVNCGNVRDKSLHEIIDSSETFQRILDRNQLQGKCGRCRYKFTCGGCRALAYYAHGDVMAEDPNCFFEPEDETTVCEHEEETNRMFKRFAFMQRAADKVISLERDRARRQFAHELDDES
ncbi:MAG: radical SAM protein [Thermoanaerobaculales bacterium]|nr:radical SAM protein [Thermoanaerobaculales bacterium]